MPAAPGPADALLVLLRWLHALAAIGFVGWSAVAWLQPGAGDARRYREVVEVTLVLFLASGAVLSFDRLAGGAGNLYAGLLALKVLCAVVAYQYAFRWRRLGLPARAADGRLVLVFGTAAVLLAAVLKEVFERGLRSQL